jgi:hypothetical protein
MPARVGQWIETPLGYRRILGDELAKGLGVPKDTFLSPTRVPPRLVNNLVGVHLWDLISVGLESLLLALSGDEIAFVQDSNDEPTMPCESPRKLSATTGSQEVSALCPSPVAPSGHGTLGLSACESNDEIMPCDSPRESEWSEPCCTKKASDCSPSLVVPPNDVPLSDIYV